MFACTSCGVVRPLADFRVRKNGYRIPKCRVCERAYQREWSQRNPDLYRQRKRESMAKRRAANPEAVRAYQRALHHKNKDRKNAIIRGMTATRIFWARSKKLKGVTALQLFGLWKSQKGRCALTGRPLNRDAQVDHILPRARGGSDDIGNLRWVCEEANIAKRHLTDDEFIALCSDVLRWIGERIQMVENIAHRETSQVAA